MLSSPLFYRGWGKVLTFMSRLSPGARHVRSSNLLVNDSRQGRIVFG